MCSKLKNASHWKYVEFMDDMCFTLLSSGTNLSIKIVLEINTANAIIIITYNSVSQGSQYSISIILPRSRRPHLSYSTRDGRQTCIFSGKKLTRFIDIVANGMISLFPKHYSFVIKDKNRSNLWLSGFYGQRGKRMKTLKTFCLKSYVYSKALCLLTKRLILSYFG